jgi:hypothetical protein
MEFVLSIETMLPIEHPLEKTLRLLVAELQTVPVGLSFRCGHSRLILWLKERGRRCKRLLAPILNKDLDYHRNLSSNWQTYLHSLECIVRPMHQNSSSACSSFQAALREMLNILSTPRGGSSQQQNQLSPGGQAPSLIEQLFSHVYPERSLNR